MANLQTIYLAIIEVYVHLTELAFYTIPEHNYLISYK